MPPTVNRARGSATSAAAANQHSSSFRTLSHWGAFTAHVEGGRLVSVSPFEHDPHPNTLIDAWPEMGYAKNRGTAPMGRAVWLRSPRGAPAGVRGDDAFVAVSWDEALDLIAGEVARVRERYG